MQKHAFKPDLDPVPQFGGHFSAEIREVLATGQAVVIERRGEPVAVVMPIQEYEMLLRLKNQRENEAREAFLTVAKQQWEAHQDWSNEDETAFEEAIEAAKKEARADLHARKAESRPRNERRS